MQGFLEKIIPNIMSKPGELFTSLGQTLQMMLVSGSISLVFGIIFGVIITVTSENGVLRNKVVFNILDKAINILRSVPFVIMIAWVIPLTRAIVGTAIGTKGAIPPLVFGTVPFFTRQIESALAEVDHGLIEAAESMGLKTILWSKDTVDWRDKDEETTFLRATQNAEGGDLILMHPMEHTVKALPRILDDYAAHGLRAVTVSENLG